MSDVKVKNSKKCLQEIFETIERIDLCHNDEMIMWVLFCLKTHQLLNDDGIELYELMLSEVFPTI